MGNFGKAVVVVALLLVAPEGMAVAGAGVELRLPAGERLDARWRLKAFPEPGSKRQPHELVDVRLASDPSVGRCLAVGPWMHGLWSARVEYVQPLPARAMELRGFYRTEDLPPWAAALSIEHLDAGERRITREDVRLDPAEGWHPLSVRIDRFAPGAAHIRLGFGLAEKGAGRVWFAQLRLQPVQGEHPLAGLAPPPLSRPAPPPKQDPSGFFCVGRFGQTWWLIDPDGRPFYSLATDGPSAPQGEDRIAHCDHVVGQLRTWGLNSLAGWSNLWHYSRYNTARAGEGEPTMPLFYCLNFHLGAGEQFDALTDRDSHQKSGDHGFPDPFDPRFRAVIAQRVRQRVELVTEQPWFAGWFVDNEMDFDQLYRYVWSPHCAEALLAHLERKYATISALNARWGTHFEGFEALAREKPEPEGQAGPVYEDFLEFERVLVGQYVQVSIEAVRAYDQNHLICSNRYMMSGLPHWMRTIDLAGAYDVVAVNLYPMNRTPGLGDSAVTVLRTVHQRTGRPLLITEWSVPALDSGLYEMNRQAPLDWSWPRAVATQDLRAAQAARVTADYFNLPFVVGSHWFTWRDFDSDERQANRGLVRADGRPWPTLTRALTEVHTRIGEHMRAEQPFGGEGWEKTDVTGTLRRRLILFQIEPGYILDRQFDVQRGQ